MSYANNKSQTDSRQGRLRDAGYTRQGEFMVVWSVRTAELIKLFLMVSMRY